MADILIPSILTLSFVLIHFFSKYISLPNSIHRQFISFSAGIGIVYIFIHLWPQVAHSQSSLEESFQWLSGHVFQYTFYLVALVGLVTFYTLDRLIARAYEHDHIQDPNVLDSNLYWAHISFFALYNMVIGYLVTLENEWDTSLIIYLIAFGLHFITNDWGLRNHHEDAYDHYGRHILSGSILIGFVVGMVFDFPEFVAGGMEAFIVGAMTLNVIKYELPSEMDGRLEGFLIGVGTASILFILL